jgi:hypothetical protein
VITFNVRNESRIRGVERSRFAASMKNRENLRPISLPTLSIYENKPVTYFQGRLLVNGEVVRVRKGC